MGSRVIGMPHTVNNVHIHFITCVILAYTVADSDCV
jgi:hypothetical protein